MSQSRVYYSAPCCQLSYLPDNISLDSPVTQYDTISEPHDDLPTNHTTLCDNMSFEDVDDCAFKSLDDVATPKNTISDFKLSQAVKCIGKKPEPSENIVDLTHSDSSNSIHFTDFVVKPKDYSKVLDAAEECSVIVQGLDSKLDTTLKPAVYSQPLENSGSYAVKNRNTTYRMRVPLAQRLLTTPPDSDSDSIMSEIGTQHSSTSNENNGNEKRMLSASSDNLSMELYKKLTKNSNKCPSRIKTVPSNTSNTTSYVKSSGFRMRASSINIDKVHKQMQLFM